MPRGATAFCPGHVTGLFTVASKADDPLQRGSRGAGFCTDLGVRATVTVEEHGSYVMDGRSRPSALLDSLISIWPQQLPPLRIEMDFDLPIGQGFGMSAAGLVAAATAVAAATDSELPSAELAALAHRVEIRHQTGLGDVAAVMAGGFEVRKRPGLPPMGEIKTYTQQMRVVLVVLDPATARPTAPIISDPTWQAKITHWGEKLLVPLEAAFEPSVFATQAWKFALETGLATDSMKELIGERWEGKGSMCMLGNSVFFLDLEVAELELPPGSKVFATAIGNEGPQLVE